MKEISECLFKVPVVVQKEQELNFMQPSVKVYNRVFNDTQDQLIGSGFLNVTFTPRNNSHFAMQVTKQKVSMATKDDS